VPRRRRRREVRRPLQSALPVARHCCRRAGARLCRQPGWRMMCLQQRVKQQVRSRLQTCPSILATLRSTARAASRSFRTAAFATTAKYNRLTRLEKWQGVDTCTSTTLRQEGRDGSGSQEAGFAPRLSISFLLRRKGVDLACSENLRPWICPRAFMQVDVLVS